MNISVKSRHSSMRSSKRKIALSFLAISCWAQAPQHLSVDPPAQVTVKRGEEFSQKLTVSIQPGFHVNSNKPKDEFLIPLKLTWAPGTITAESVSYPATEVVKVGNVMLSEFNCKVVLKQ